jgi:hypothetical protein
MMFSTTLWLTALVLESFLLLRAFQGNFLKRYPLFYLYLGYVLVCDGSLMLVYYLRPKLYAYAYWSGEFLSVVLGCGVVWEVYRVALSRYPGAARMARNVLPFFFIFATSRIVVKAWNSPNWIPGRTTLETELLLRIVQTALLAGMVALIAYYAIPVGRDLKGIIYGFSVLVGTSVTHLSLRGHLGDRFQVIWQYTQSMSYILVLLVWCATLWSSATAPEPETPTRLELDYQALAFATKRQLRAAHSYLFKAPRS